MKSKILTIEIIIFLAAIVSIFIIEYGLKVYAWDKLICNTTSGILIAIASGLSVGILYEIFFRKELTNEVYKLVNIKKEQYDSGIERFFSDFKYISVEEIKQLILTANNIDMYFTYAGTFINNNSSILFDAFKKKEKTINFYLMDSNNPFLKGLANLWEKQDKKYDLSGIQNKISDSISTLKDLAETVRKNGDCAEINIYKINYHPINFSFYRYDDKIIFCPTKLTERKNTYPAIAIVCEKRRDSDLYNWVYGELEYIRNIKDGLTKIYTTR